MTTLLRMAMKNIPKFLTVKKHNTKEDKQPYLEKEIT